MKVIYPGTFDPPTKGHLNIIEKGSRIFETVEVAIGVDTEKETPLFTTKKRLEFLETITQKFQNVHVSFFDGLLIRHAKEKGCHLILRSLRTYTDFEKEKALAYSNKELDHIETIFLLPDEPFQSISSSIVRDIAKRGEDLSPFIPEEIVQEVDRTLREGR